MTMSIASPETSLSLLGRLSAGEDDAWGRLVAVYGSLMQKWMASAGLQQADRDDLTQRALEILVRELPEFRHGGRRGSFRAWLRGVVVNLLREFWRQRRATGSQAVLAQLSDP